MLELFPFAEERAANAALTDVEEPLDEDVVPDLGIF